MNDQADHDGPSKGILNQLFLSEVSTLPDLERHLKLPRDLITEELVSGRLRGAKIGGQWLIHRDALKAWLNVYRGGL